MARRPERSLALAAAAVSVFLLAALAPPTGRAEIIVRLEITAEKGPVHLEPDPRSPIVETLPRGAVVKQASAMRFRTDWLYVQFTSARSGRLLSGYVLEGCVRKLNSTLKVVDLTPSTAIENPREFDLESARLPAVMWGMGRESIVRIEGRPLAVEEAGAMEFIRYRREVCGKRCLIIYALANRRLVSARISLIENYADKDRYIADYNKIRDYLNRKIGEPRFDNVIWKDRSYAERGETLGVAVTTGSLSLSSEWVTGDTGLRLSLTGEPNGILFAAEINDIKAKNPASF
ncbi:MAG TPA: hypothetical protein PLP83_07470 [Candidatus Aminicenantes bacterium]|nr:hypothetical protein [Candidatus Aminicenantes bacterium]